MLGFSVPNFWLGMMLILLFSVWLGWLPASGRGEPVSVMGVGLSTPVHGRGAGRTSSCRAINLALANIAAGAAHDAPRA